MTANLATPLLNFRPYVAELRALTCTPGESQTERDAIVAALDGQPSKKLRTLIKQDYLRKTGSFFTGKYLAERLIRRLKVTDSAIIVDPACGVGDLLVAAAWKLRLRKTFEQTMDAWGRILHGYDLHKEFVDATKLRLCLLLRLRNLRPTTRIDLNAILPNIQVGDGLKASAPDGMNIALMNPPYTWVQTSTSWGQGTVCSAGLFVDRWLSFLNTNGKLVALLPDVLRTGSHYDAWRDQLLAKARINHIGVIGRFEKSVDVDVFLLDVVAGRQRKAVSKDSWRWYGTERPYKTVGDFFHVHAGRIVPHRDTNKGPHCSYVHARTAKPWATLTRISEKKKSQRPLFYPPFVLVRRTSSPSDKKRAVGTLVIGQRGVGVENHLLVLTPKRGAIPKCEDLMQVLKCSATSEWLNKRIRCRHLTVGVLSELPWEF
jgi:hypothetical protein